MAWAARATGFSQLGMQRRACASAGACWLQLKVVGRGCRGSAPGCCCRLRVRCFGRLAGQPVQAGDGLPCTRRPCLVAPLCLPDRRCSRQTLRYPCHDGRSGDRRRGGWEWGRRRGHALPAGTGALVGPAAAAAIPPRAGATGRVWPRPLTLGGGHARGGGAERATRARFVWMGPQYLSARWPGQTAAPVCVLALSWRTNASRSCGVGVLPVYPLGCEIGLGLVGWGGGWGGGGPAACCCACQ